MPISSSDLNFYLTSLEHAMTQNIYSQSIGGYISDSLVYPETTVSSTIVSLYDTTMNLTPVSQEEALKWQSIQYIACNGEIMSRSSIDVSTGVNSDLRRAVNGCVKVHLNGDKVRGLHNKLFNNVLNEYYRQYRCVAIKNASATESAHNVFIGLTQNSSNPNSIIRIAVELPKSPYISGTASSLNSMMLIDSSLINYYADDTFKGAVLRITSGPNQNQTVIVNSFDDATGTFTFASALPVVSSSSSSSSSTVAITYEVEPSPSQRLATGTIEPLDNGRMSEFATSNSDMMTSINVLGTATGDVLGPNEVVYLWLERYIKKGAESFADNNIILNLKYTLS